MDKLSKKIANLTPKHYPYEGEVCYEEGWNMAVCAVGNLIESEMQ